MKIITILKSEIYNLKFAMLHLSNLYEFEKEAGGGLQSTTTIPQNLVFGLRVLPNIISRNASLRYTISTRQRASLKLYDILGREVMMISDGIVDAGIHSYNLKTSHFSSGIYFLILEGEKETRTQKVLVVR